MIKLFLKKQNLFLINILLRFIDSKKIYRKLILILFDYLIIYFSFQCLFYLIGYKNFLFFIYFIVIALPTYLLTKQFKPLTRFIGSYAFYQIFLRNFFVGILSSIMANLFNFQLIGFKYSLMFSVLVFILQSSLRIIVRDSIRFLLSLKYSKNSINRIAIYKADHLGVEFSNILKFDRNWIVEVFIDNNPTMEGCSINNIPIVSLKTFKQKKLYVNKVIMASENISFKELKKIKNYFKNINTEVVEINPLKQLKDFRFSSNQVKSFSSTDLLNRKISDNFEDIKKEIKNKKISICVTGAGGSIGSELCRQIISMKPFNLIIIDFCEFNLYKIYEELKELNISETKIFAKLLNAKNQFKLEEIFKEHDIDVVYHAAAYKHVPMVEINKTEGIMNNLSTTRSVSMAAIKNNISKVVLISSDKAVRPTNIMGATKLFSELIVKKLSSLSNSKTIFSTVRFGNVIDSSGSVIPLFRSQIKSGGPLTITHPDMERYFMTIAEAVNLVLEASIIMKGGETFILDMGKRIKIIDLAKNMIISSGLRPKNINEKNGDIEIKITGIRPGEKIKEELTINGYKDKTAHPLINIAREEIKIPNDFMENINQIITLIENNKEKQALSIFNDLCKKI